MSQQKNDELVKTALIIGAAYFLIGKPIMEFLGIKKGEGTKAFELQNADPNSPFNTTYWRNYLYAGNTAPNGRKPVTGEMLARLRSAANYFYYGFDSLGEDEEAIFNAVSMCKSKAEVSLMSFLVQQNYAGNILSLMKFGKGSLPNSGLSDSELQNIFNKVSRLPTV